jgi:molecular chaperone GrpE
MKKQTDDAVQPKKDITEPVQSEEMKEIELWKDKYIRALADYQNMEKRARDEQNQIRMFAGLSVIEKLLPVVDLLEKAQAHLKDQGLDLALKELDSFFRTVGVEKIDVLGKLFDPYSMDCIEISEEGEENIVVSVLSPGYRMHNKFIRPAKVTVGKKLENIKSENS